MVRAKAPAFSVAYSLLIKSSSLLNRAIYVCRGELLATLCYNKVFYIVLLYGFLAALFSFGFVALVIVVCRSRVGRAFDTRHHIPTLATE